MGTVYLPNYAAPLASDFPTLVQASGAGLTLTDSNNGLRVTQTAQSAGVHAGLALRPVSAGAFSIAAKVSFATSTYYAGFGICIYNSSTGHFTSVVTASDASTPWVWAVQAFSDTSTYSANRVYRTYIPSGGLYYRIDYDGASTINYSIGTSATNYTVVYTESTSAFMGSFDKAGLYMNNGTTGTNSGLVTWYQDTSLSPRKILVNTP